MKGIDQQHQQGSSACKFPAEASGSHTAASCRFDTVLLLTATKSVKSWQGWEPARATKLYKQIVIIGESLLDAANLCWPGSSLQP